MRLWRGSGDVSRLKSMMIETVEGVLPRSIDLT